MSLGSDGAQMIPEILDTFELRELAAQYVAAPVSLRALGGERDTNVGVVSGDGRRYVLKIAELSASVDLAKFEVDILENLERVDPGLPVPRVVRPPNGGHAVTRWQPTGERLPRAVRMYTYLAGQPLHLSAPSSTRLWALGEMLARLDTDLATLTRPRPACDLEWDLRRAPATRDQLGNLEDPALAERALDRYERAVSGRSLPEQLIHNDANPHNVLCDLTKLGSIAGLIDFGDVVNAPAVQDLATACAYQMGAVEDPMSAPTALVRGYHARRPLSESELAVLPEMIGARQVLSVVLSAANARRQPENRHYLMRNSRQSWVGLRNLDALGLERVRAVLQTAIDE